MLPCFNQFGLCPENDNTKYNNVHFNSMKRKAGSENKLHGFSPTSVTCDKFQKHFVNGEVSDVLLFLGRQSEFILRMHNF